eukprot:SAG31_NODE_575_length_13961_cov_41.577550_11_plen_44_part_00
MCAHIHATEVGRQQREPVTMLYNVKVCGLESMKIMVAEHLTNC